MTNCHNISPSELGSQPFHEVSKDIDLRQTSPHIQKVWEKSSPWALGEMKKGLRSWPVAAEVGQFILDNAASDKRSIGEWDDCNQSASWWHVLWYSAGLIYPQSPWRECTFNVIQLFFCLLISFIGLVRVRDPDSLGQPFPPKCDPNKKCLETAFFFFRGKQPNQKFPGGIPSWTLPLALRCLRKNGLNAAEGALQAAKKMASWPAGCLPGLERLGVYNFSYRNWSSYLWSLKSGWGEMRCLFFFGRDEWRVLYSFGKWKHVENKWLCTSLHMFTEMV